MHNKKNKIYIKDLLDFPGGFDLRISVLAGESGLNNEIPTAEVNRPGLSLTGFFDFFAYDRIQIFGRGETSYLKKLDDENRDDIYDKFFSYNILCCIFTHGDEPSNKFMKYALKYNIPVLLTEHKTTRFISLLTHLIEQAHAPVITKHGTLVDVWGLGVLLIGKSGVGKSETALELVERGHRLVADDIVEIKRIDDSLIFGSGSDLIKYHLEIRGIGIINVKDIYGIRSIRKRKRIELIVSLEDWDENKTYDRLGIEERFYTLLDIDIPYIVIPVRPGRNIPVIVEAAALNQRMKKMGVNSAKELDEKLQSMLKKEAGLLKND